MRIEIKYLSNHYLPCEFTLSTFKIVPMKSAIKNRNHPVGSFIVSMTPNSLSFFPIEPSNYNFTTNGKTTKDEQN